MEVKFLKERITLGVIITKEEIEKSELVKNNNNYVVNEFNPKTDTIIKKYDIDRYGRAVTQDVIINITYNFYDQYGELIIHHQYVPFCALFNNINGCKDIKFDVKKVEVVDTDRLLIGRTLDGDENIHMLADTKNNEIQSNQTGSKEWFVELEFSREEYDKFKKTVMSEKRIVIQTNKKESDTCENNKY